MADPDYELIDGFDKYGPVTGSSLGNADETVTTGEWTAAAGSLAILSPLVSGKGAALGNNSTLYKQIAANCARSIGCLYFSKIGSTSNVPGLIMFYDGTTAQCCLTMDVNGNIDFRRGGTSGTSLGTYNLGLPLNGVMTLAWDVTVHNSAGIAKIWINGGDASGNPQINLSGIDNGSTANNYFTRFYIDGNGTQQKWDHLWAGFYTASGGSEVPPIDGPYVDTDWANGDDTTAGTIPASLAGTNAYSGQSNTTSANFLRLSRFTADTSGNLASVSLRSGSSSAGAKFKGVLYADSAGSPAALIATGNEVVGVTSNTVATSAFGTPPAVVQGTAYWMGIIIDTNITIDEAYDNTGSPGRGLANTYASGAPASAASASAGNKFMFWGPITGSADSYSAINNSEGVPSSDSYTQLAAVGDEDLLSFPALEITPASIYRVHVKAFMLKSDANPLSADLRTKSSGTSSSGQDSGLQPGITGAWAGSRFPTDPATGVAWTGTLSGVKHGYKLAA